MFYFGVIQKVCMLHDFRPPPPSPVSFLYREKCYFYRECSFLVENWILNGGMVSGGEKWYSMFRG